MSRRCRVRWYGSDASRLPASTARGLLGEAVFHTVRARACSKGQASRSGLHAFKDAPGAGFRGYGDLAVGARTHRRLVKANLKAASEARAAQKLRTAEKYLRAARAQLKQIRWHRLHRAR